MAAPAPRLAAALAAGGAAALAVAAPVPGHATAPGLGFAPPVLVDRTLAGGEPFVAYSPKSGLLVYTAHEGTTHLFSSNLPGAPAESGGWVANYRNQVNVWTSADNGATWQVTNALAGFFTPPQQNTGFSDPDLTQDEAGNLYNTGIDLANDALFASLDGGKTWANGTIQCHEGDRPWLAGGRANEVFLSTDADSPPGHIVVRSTDAGSSCGSTTITDNGGVGKLFYDHQRGNLVEPVVSSDGVGIGILKNASTVFDQPGAAFTQVKIAKTTVFAHWPSMAIDSAGNYYMVWDTDDRAPNTSGGCGGQTVDGIAGSTVETPTPLANSILMAVSKDGGQTWSAPITIAHNPGHRVLWPWVTAGSAGRAGVVWYQYDSVTDPDCATGNVSLMAAEVSGATDPALLSEQVVDAVGRPVHSGPICQGGTTCAATGALTGEDRRLGDFFTVGTDARGCILVATGDTTLNDSVTGQPSPISHPLFARQNSGSSLTGQPCGPATAAATGGSAAGSGGGSSGGGGVLGLANTSAPAARPAGLLALPGAAGAWALARRRRSRVR